ncbi:protein stoned-A [Anthonomus grandis grandis]|uniref:protein stoned-A n=1 Tax=Anthonomus grandis grandis TaxID=2921223 RepID=UPI0021650CBA|nr:protein stoned-A [Anthonomus grandis grandis]XP_050307879.1 protein stoned-A [Anthonomus grandis grandis]
MHKLAKGLKKKKKGKKSKHKEEELFKPEELEEYRRQHAATSEETAKNEEWKNFLSLTSGVDDILKKTQDDLDRIKSTSFFQRVPPPSETEKKRQQEEEALRATKAQEEAKSVKEQPEQLGIVQVSESESEEEEEDDIFDTTYIDAIAAGEVKLAYIPESPTDKPDGDDPFDTSYAERAILGPAAERKGKKLVPLGAAVEVLTGRATLPTCATVRPVSRRQILKERDLLLGSFDGSDPSAATSELATSPEKPPKTLLDDDEIPLPDEPIDLSKSLYIPPPQPSVETTQQNILKEFEEDEDDKEFEALAAESLAKPLTNVVSSEVLQKVSTAVVVEGSTDWKPFENHADVSDNYDDPFDTTFAENILPGKAELKLLEKDLLEDQFDPRAAEGVAVVKKPPTRVADSELTLIKPVHRDLLGGSTSDLSKLGDKPILPTEEAKSEEVRYSDPFDTSIVDSVKAPGQAELKFLEKELLSDLNTSVSKAHSIDDDDFNPRALETQTAKARTLSRPDVLNVAGSKTVSFAVPKDLLGAEDTTKVAKPLTPFYVRKNSVPGTKTPESPANEPADPFDTSFVPSLAPGKTELKIIESELCNINTTVTIDDPHFDPRDESKIAKVVAVETIKDIVNPKSRPSLNQAQESVDLLSAVNDIAAKVLTPAATNSQSSTQEAVLSYADPFDTSVVATNILPGKAELRLLESELIESAPVEDSKDLLVHSGDIIIEKPLSPEVGQSFDIEPDDFDPFDTSFATNIQPGRAELKVLESELI